MTRNVWKCTSGHVRPVKIQIRLRIRAVWSESSLCANWIAGDVKFLHITKTYLYYFDPLKTHFYIVKLGFTGVYIIFLISAQKHRMWVLVRTASSRRFLTSTHNLCFEQKYEKYQHFFSENFHFLVVKFSLYLNRLVFVMMRATKADQTAWIRRLTWVCVGCTCQKVRFLTLRLICLYMHCRR